MSASVKDALSLPKHDGQTERVKNDAPKGNYKGFVAGVFSGVAKLSGECIYICVWAHGC